MTNQHYEPEPAERRRMESRRLRDNVSLAVYWLADAEGLFCQATNAEIAREAGTSVKTARRFLHVMERNGTIMAVRPGAGVRRRTIVLMDHPESVLSVSCMLGCDLRKPEWHTGVALGYPGYQEQSSVPAAGGH